MLEPQVEAFLARGWTNWLVTLTVRHSQHDPLLALFALFRRAWGMTTSGDDWADFRKLGAPQYVRGYDVTYTKQNGWHLHLHVSLFLPPGHGDGEAAVAWFARRWRKKVASAGGIALAPAQDARRVANAAEAAAYAVRPAAVYETLTLATKRQRAKESGHEAGRTPFEIADAAAAWDAEADAPRSPRDVALWLEYLEASKSNKQVAVSRGIKLKADKVLLQEADGEQPDGAGTTALASPVRIARLDGRALRDADRKGLIPLACEAVEAHADDLAAAGQAVWAILSGIEDGEWSIIVPGPEGEPPLVPPEEPPRPGTVEFWRWHRLKLGLPVE